MTSAAFDRLNTGYYNNNLLTGANPGGLAGTGAVRKNFIGGVVLDFVTVAAEVAANATLAQAAASSAINAPGTSATSASNLTIATGAQNLVLAQANKLFSVGQTVVIADTAAPATNLMVGQISAFNPATGAMTVNVTSVLGAGTKAAWAVSLGAFGGIQGSVNLPQDVRFSGAIAPAALAADQNDWNPAGLATAAVVKATGTAARTITGLAAGADGRIIKLQNVGAFDLVLAANSASSAAANRFDLTTAFALRPKQAVELIYDGTAALWRIGGDGPARPSDIRSGTDLTVGITPGDLYAAHAEVALTDAATIAVDLSTFINAAVTLGGNRTLGSPTNLKTGQSGEIRIVQDATGSRTLSFAAGWKRAGGPPVLTTTANAYDVLVYKVLGNGTVLYDLKKNPS